MKASKRDFELFSPEFMISGRENWVRRMCAFSWILLTSSKTKGDSRVTAYKEKMRPAKKSKMKTDEIKETFFTLSDGKKDKPFFLSDVVSDGSIKQHPGTLVRLNFEK